METIVRNRVSRSFETGFESRLSRFPVWKRLAQEAIKSRTVIVDNPMAEFMDDDIIDALDRRLDEFGIQVNIARYRAAPPT